MPQKWVSALTDLPVIVQGALGSALFAVALVLGQRLFRYLSFKTGEVSKERRIAAISDELAKLRVMDGRGLPEQGAYITLLVFRALRNLAKGLVWLTLGTLFGSFVPYFGSAGYLGALYYLFAALNTLRAPDEPEDVAARIEELKAERETLKAKA